MFKGFGDNMNLGSFFGKRTGGDRRSAPATQEGGQQPPFKVLTLGDLPKLSAPTIAAPTSAPLVAPQMPTQPTIVPRIETQSVTWSEGPGRRPSDHTVIPSSPDGMKSYAASVVSPNTPQPNKYDYVWNSNGLAPPMPATNPFYSRADEEQDDDARSPYDNKSFFNYYANEQTSPNPQVQRNESQKSTKSNNEPTLKTNMLNLDGWSPSSSSFSNPFGMSPRNEYQAYPAYFSSSPYIPEVSPVSPEEPFSQETRYSDCGVNPFQGLDEAARKERDSGAVGDIWDMITGQVQEVKKKPAPAPSPKINIDTSALDARAAGPGPSALRKTLTHHQIPEPLSAKSPVAVSPCEWFKEIIIQYEGRPAEVNRAMSYYPTPNSPHPQGLSPPEITTAAVPYLASIENELEELKRTSANPEAEVKTQEERDRVRNLIQRQLAHEQAYDALEQATGGKRLTRDQLDPAKIWEEIDLTGVRKEIPIDRRSVSSTGTAWPTFESGAKHAPPVPKIPAQHAAPAAKVPKESRFAKALLSPFKRTQKKEKEAAFPSRPQEARIAQETPIIFTTTGLGLDASSLGPTKRLSMDSNSSYAGPDYSRSGPERDTFADRFAPSKEESRSEIDFNLNEKASSPGHARNESTNTVSAPPPYSQGTTPNISKSSESRRFQSISEEAPIQSGRRFPIRASDIPRISTGSSGQGMQQLNANVGGLSQMQFTPTTPRHARYSIPQSRPLGGNVTLNDFTTFRSNTIGDQRARAEKQRRRQEKRRKLFGRGGWLYLCGCFFVRSTSKKIKFFWWAFFISLIVIAATLGTMAAVRASNAKTPTEQEKPLKLINLPGLPPMPAEEITVTPRLVNTVSTCISPSTLWSCKLPQPLADGVVAEQPIFRWKVWALNGTNDLVTPNPILPALDEYKNMSKIDGVIASPPEGEPTNFYIDLLPSNTTTKPDSNSQQVPQKVKRSHGRHFPRATATPSVSVAENLPLPPATLLPPQYTSQQLRFFDRGLPTEHFKFITHFQKTIYLRTTRTMSSIDGGNKLDAEGGVSPSEARFVCSWPETRYVTKIFTNPDRPDENNKRMFIVDPNTIGVIKDVNAGGFAGYAVQIEEDIATYDNSKRSTISCWSIDDRGKIDTTTMRRSLLVEGISTGKAGVDYRGCQCTWSNFKTSTGQGL